MKQSGICLVEQHLPSLERTTKWLVTEQWERTLIGKWTAYFLPCL